MGTAWEPKAESPVRKMQPSAKLPTDDLLRAFSKNDCQMLERRLSEMVECVYHPTFEAPDAENDLLAPLPDSPAAVDGANTNDDSGVDLLAGLIGRALTIDQERHIFLRLNYCRFRLMELMIQHEGKQLSASAAQEVIRWERLTRQARSDIVRVNVPLVLAMSKRTRITNVDYSDLISEGNLALLRSVDKFDCSRGFKFSTYACRAILKSFSRVAVRTARYRGYFPTEFDPILEKGDQLEQKRTGVENDCVDELKSILGKNLANLNPIEERVIRARFCLEQDRPADPELPLKAKTLEQVGEMIGVTKERVRQIQNKALGKLRGILQDGVLAS